MKAEREPPRRPAPTPTVRIVQVRNASDIVTARQTGRALGAALKFSSGELTMIATAISEVARNIIQHAGQGEIEVAVDLDHGKPGIIITARDRGPGIADISKALQVGYSTANGLGLGLPGAKQLMDEFSVVSETGKGTVITMKKW